MRTGSIADLLLKQYVPNQQAFVSELKACADVRNATDEKMLSLRKQIEAASDIPTEEDILFEKPGRFDIDVH